MSQTCCTQPILVCTSCRLQKGIWLFCRTIGSEVRQVHLQGVAKIFEIRTCLKKRIMSQTLCIQPILVGTLCRFQKCVWLFCRTIGSEVRQGVAKIFEIHTCLTSEPTVPQKRQRTFWKQRDMPTKIGWVQSVCNMIRISKNT